MKKLKCSDCGAALVMRDVPGEGLYGHCPHCRTSYLVNPVDRSHVVVDMHFPDGLPKPPAATISRRGALAAGAVALIGGGMFAALNRAGKPHGKTPSALRPVWNVGGEGAGPGQFRNYVQTLRIDAQGRSTVTLASSPVVQWFDGDGQFLSRWTAAAGSDHLLIALPGGDLVFVESGKLVRRDPATGRELRVIDDGRSRGTNYSRDAAITPDGVIGIYKSDYVDPTDGGAKVFTDHMDYISADGLARRTVGPLLGRIIRPDPMITKGPEVASMAIDGAGTIFLLLRRSEDYDTREGIYVFDADGTFLRKIEIEQKYHGYLAATAEGGLYHADPWSSIVTRIKGAETSRIDLDDISRDGGEAVGRPFEIAAFPNGDLGLVTSASRFLRIAWPAQQLG